MNQQGQNNHNWRGGLSTHTKGYRLVHAPAHPRAQNGYIMEHLQICESILGPLPPGATPHHINADPADNRPDNLIVCLTNAGHTALEAYVRRLRQATVYHKPTLLKQIGAMRKTLLRGKPITLEQLNALEALCEPAPAKAYSRCARGLK